MDERLCVNRALLFSYLAGGPGQKENGKSQARMPAWQLLPEPLHHALTLHSRSRTEQPRKWVGEPRTGLAGSGEKDMSNKWEVRRSDGKTFTPRGEYLPERPSASLMLAFFVFGMSSWTLSFLELGTVGFPELVTSECRGSPGQESGEGTPRRG